MELLSWVNPELCDESWKKKASIPTDEALAMLLAVSPVSL